MKRFFYLTATGFIALSVAFSCTKPVVKEQPSPRDQYEQAMNYYNKGNNLKAQSQLQKIIYSFPGQTFIDTAQYYLGLTYYNIKNYSQSIAEYKRLLDTYPSSALADAAQFYTAMSHYKESPGYSLEQTETFSAIDEFSTLLDKYPNSSYVEAARKNLNNLYDKLAEKMYKNGELYLKLHDYGPAILYFGQVRDNYPSTAWARLAFYNTGVAQLKNGQKNDALETFQNFITAFPDDKLVKNAHKEISKLQPQEAGG
jgi:outer membrane protein assembly factor BamD